MATELSARKTIEALRAGVPSRAAVSELGTTQEQIQERFRETLRAVEEGIGARPLVVSANFGDGKSHLLRCLQAQAEIVGFVTSLVVVSPETPLGSAQAVLKEIAENAEAPGRTGKAVRELASNAPREAAGDLFRWARNSDIQDRFKAMLRVYDATNADEDLRIEILGDLEGRPVAKSRLKEELRRLGEASYYDLSSPRAALLAHDRIRLLAQFFRSHRAKGLIVFFDEVERIERFSFKARLAAYQELGWWRSLCEQGGSSVFVVCAETAGAIEQACLLDKGDEERMVSGVSLLHEDRDRFAIDGIDMFKSSVMRLVPVTDPQLESLQHGVRELYGRAYNGLPGPVSITKLKISVRSEIRRWITIWDLERHDPSYRANVQSAAVSFDATDIEDEQLAGEDGELTPG